MRVCGVFVRACVRCVCVCARACACGVRVVCVRVVCLCVRVVCVCVRVCVCVCGVCVCVMRFFRRKTVPLFDMEKNYPLISLSMIKISLYEYSPPICREYLIVSYKSSK